MKRFMYISFFMSAFICGSLCAVPAAKKPWTVMVYLAAVNNLNEFAYSDLAEMMKVGSNNNVNVIVYLNILQDNGTTSTLRLYVEKGRLMQIGAPGSEDSGSVDTLKKALTWALTDYPSDYIAVVLWDHGSGILNKNERLTLRGICYDDVTNNYLTDRDCLDAFSWAQNTYRNGKKFDIIACDACLMAMVEMAYTLASCTTYFVASQETIPGDGYDYERVLNTFLNTIPSPLNLTKTMVTAYQDEYVGTPDYTLSAIDSSKIGAFLENLKQITSMMITVLKGSKAKYMRSYLARSYTKSLKFNEGLYCDIGTFFTAFKSYIPKIGLSSKDAKKLDGLVSTGINLLKQCVITKVSSYSYKTASGLSFYFPPYYLDSSYNLLYWTEKNPFMLQLLESYLQ